MIKKAIPVFRGYFVTPEGDVLSWWGRGSTVCTHRNERFLKPLVSNRHGHLYVWLYKNGKRHKRYVHRLVLEVFVGSCPEGMQCRHLDGDAGNNTLDNLAWGTQSENESDKVSHGRSNRCQRHGMAVLSNSQAREVKRWLSAGARVSVLAREYRVSCSTISLINNGVNWRHLSESL